MSVNRTLCGVLARLALSPKLAALRADLIAAGVTAESPLMLDAEGERLARDERQDGQ